jgi:protein dithiol oxidoreductase (disulfide-forming)
MSLAACLLGVALGSAAAASPVEGTDYRPIVLSVPSAPAEKIEVVEFFSYMCPHCAHFAPLVAEWAGKLPKDVTFRRVPVGFERPEWVNLARAFYALQVSGDFAKLDAPLFKAIHDEHQRLFDQGAIADWVTKNGGDGDKFAGAYGSFGVNNQTVQADRMAQDYGVDSVPAIAVNGKYYVLADGTQGEDKFQHDLLAHADAVIAMVRAARPGAAPPAVAAQPKAKASKP